MLTRRVSSNRDPLHLIEPQLVAPTIVELRGAGRGVVRHGGRVIEWLTTRPSWLRTPSCQGRGTPAGGENAEHEVFSFDDSGIDGIQVEEISS
jgi:hypothetical protein